MRRNLETALDKIILAEGSAVNLSASEPGGGSKFGVSVTVLGEARGHPCTPDDLHTLKLDEAREIYAARFARPIRFDDWSAGVDYRLLDIAVNLGVRGGTNLMELVLGVWPLTGKITDGMISEAVRRGPVPMIYALSAAWIVKKRESSNWGPSAVTSRGYGNGWTNRNNAATLAALSMAGAKQ